MKTRLAKVHIKPLARAAIVALACTAGFAVPAAGQRPGLAMLDRLETGRWELRPRGSRGLTEQICLRDGRRLIQLRHPGSTCDRLIVADSTAEVTVQYTCPGRGYGRTHIRYETGRLAQVDTQGIADGLPFDFVAEARRIGDCTG